MKRRWASLPASTSGRGSFSATCRRSTGSKRQIDDAKAAAAQLALDDEPAKRWRLLRGGVVRLRLPRPAAMEQPQAALCAGQALLQGRPRHGGERIVRRASGERVVVLREECLELLLGGVRSQWIVRSSLEPPPPGRAACGRSRGTRACGPLRPSGPSACRFRQTTVPLCAAAGSPLDTRPAAGPAPHRPARLSSRAAALACGVADGSRRPSARFHDSSPFSGTSRSMPRCPVCLYRRRTLARLLNRIRRSQATELRLRVAGELPKIPPCLNQRLLHHIRRPHLGLQLWLNLRRCHELQIRAERLQPAGQRRLVAHLSEVQIGGNETMRHAEVSA